MTRPTMNPERRHQLFDVINGLGGVSSLAAIAVLIVLFGNLPRRVDTLETGHADHEIAIQAIREKGSITLQSHLDTATERFNDVHARIARLENMMSKIDVIANDVAWIKTQFPNRPIPSP